jgi:hypothetical protein
MHARTMTPNQAKNISSPHRGTDGTSDRACASANDCARWACDEEAASPTEARASQSCAAADGQRGNESEHQPTHPTFPRRGKYPQNF